MTTDIWTETSIQELSDEDLKSFQDIVLKDVKNKVFNLNDKQILENNLDLWLYSLQVIRREIELQLAQHKTNMKIKMRDLRTNNASPAEVEEFSIVEESWRNNAMKFLMSIERKTLYVKLLHQEEK
jgi:hypothetical protein